ncbi:MAG: hypothetical protein OHK0029_10770 [Armatimonadaceae bacterium]
MKDIQTTQKEQNHLNWVKRRAVDDAVREYVRAMSEENRETFANELLKWSKNVPIRSVTAPA